MAIIDCYLVKGAIQIKENVFKKNNILIKLYENLCDSDVNLCVLTDKNGKDVDYASYENDDNYYDMKDMLSKVFGEENVIKIGNMASITNDDFNNTTSFIELLNRYTRFAKDVEELDEYIDEFELIWNDICIRVIYDRTTFVENWKKDRYRYIYIKNEEEKRYLKSNYKNDKYKLVFEGYEWDCSAWLSGKWKFLEDDNGYTIRLLE